MQRTPKNPPLLPADWPVRRGAARTPPEDKHAAGSVSGL